MLVAQKMWEQDGLHIYDLDRNKHHSKELQEDWNKYGFINFSFDILDFKYYRFVGNRTILYRII